MSEIRLGDIIDDYCTRCRLVTNHSVMAIMEGKPAKTQCRTCYHEHKYRHAKGGSKKKTSEKADLYNSILSKITGNDSD